MPALHRLPGCADYCLFRAADRIATVTLFEAGAGAAESARVALAWARASRR